MLKNSDVARCPKQSLLPAHYRADGNCLCDERERRKRALEEAEHDLRAAAANLEVARMRYAVS